MIQSGVLITAIIESLKEPNFSCSWTAAVCIVLFTLQKLSQATCAPRSRTTTWRRWPATSTSYAATLTTTWCRFYETVSPVKKVTGNTILQIQEMGSKFVIYFWMQFLDLFLSIFYNLQAFTRQRFGRNWFIKSTPGLAGAKGRLRRPVQDRAVPRTPDCPVGWHWRCKGHLIFLPLKFTIDPEG
jgi:hypothetical protein